MRAGCRAIGHCVVLRTGVLAICIAGGTASAQTAPSGDWLTFVPAEARLYVEFRNLNRVRAQLQRLGVWDAVNLLGDRAERSRLEDAWQHHSQRLLGMSREEAVTQVLGQRTAVIAADPRRWKQGLVVAQLADAAAVKQLLAQLSAREYGRGGRVRRFRSERGGLRVAVRDTLVILGPTSKPDTLWQSTLALFEGGAAPRLLDDSDVARRLNRLPPNADALVVARIGDASTGAAKAPQGTAGWLVLGARFEPQRLVADLSFPSADERLFPPLAANDDHLVRGAPGGALALWLGHFDPAHWKGAVAPAASGLLQLVSAVMGPGDPGKSGLFRVGPNAAVLLHCEAPGAVAPYPKPVLTVVVDAADPPSAAQALRSAAAVVVAYINTQLARAGAPQHALEIESRPVGPSTLHRLALGAALASYTECPFLRDLEIAWLQTGDRLIVSTSAAMVESIASAARGAMSTMPPSTVEALDGCDQRLMFRGTAIADMLQGWLNHARDTDARMLRRGWWVDRARRRAREKQQLGVTIRGSSEPRLQAVVLEVETGSPAATVLRPGDIILGVDGEGLMTDRPARELAERFRTRPREERFDIEFERDGERRAESIALPARSLPGSGVFNPPALLRPIITLGRRIESISIAARQDSPTLRTARLVVNWSPPNVRER